MSPSCKECGRDLNVDPVERPNTDWVKVVCSNCGTVDDISMVRLAAAKRQKENN